MFVQSAENANMYTANYGNNTVSQINATSDAVVGTITVGALPVALAEIPNGQKLYVANQGSGTVSSVNITGFNVGTTIPVGPTPVWAVARSDSARVYVLDNNGTIYEINTLTDTATAVPTSMGAGANYMALDPHIQRLYVTNPSSGKVGIFDVSATVNQLAVIDLGQGANAPCPGGCSPVSVTGIGDGSRAYVVSYQLASCGGSPCVSTQVEVIDTGTNTVSKVIPITTVPVDMTNPADCGPATGPPATAPWTPGTARFRAFTVSSGGGSTSNFKVYVSQCDAGSIAVIDTSAVSTGSNPHPADVFTASLTAPLSSFPSLQASISNGDCATGTGNLHLRAQQSWAAGGHEGVCDRAGLTAGTMGISPSQSGGYCRQQHVYGRRRERGGGHGQQRAAAEPFCPLRTRFLWWRGRKIFARVTASQGNHMKRATVGGSLLLGLVWLLAVSSFGQTGNSPASATLIANVSGRTAISLDGTWNTIVDPYETGLGSRFYENAKPKTKSDLVEYDFDRSPKLQVPGDWNTQRESLLFYEGVLWYQRYFSYQKRERKRTFLYFGAANYQARVWLNGVKLGEHQGGFTPFDFEVTDKIADGENSVVVEVDNTRRADGVPSTHTDWWNYGGLTRSVQLIEVPETFIENYAVHLAKDGGQIEGWVQFNGPRQRNEVTVEIPEIHLKQTTLVNPAGRAVFSFPAKLDLWSPENPKLYRIVISGEGDRVTDDIGFRTLEDSRNPDSAERQADFSARDLPA